MALVECLECKVQISDQAKTCPQCGAKVPHTKWWLWIPLGLIVVLLIFGTIAGNSPEAKAKQQERLAIDICWERSEAKSLDPATQRFAAGACEMMEQRFLEKHGVKP